MFHPDPSPPSDTRPRTRWALALLGLVLAAGVFLRLPAEKPPRPGFDEAIYARYVAALGRGNSFAALHADYLRDQPGRDAFLPPTRVAFLASAAGWRAVTGAEPLEAVRAVSCAAGCALLGLGALWAWRLGGAGMALAVGALLACAPLSIHLAHRALIDGFFAWWATLTLWLAWESLRAPGRRAWRVSYGAALAAMVLTKQENAVFVWLALCAVLAVSRWTGPGAATRWHWLATVAGPAAGTLALVLSAGRPAQLVAVYRLNVEKTLVLPYGIVSGDGPWFRYLSDLLLVSPLVLLLAVGTLARLGRGAERAAAFFGVFIAVSMGVMCQVKQGMNLRYGAVWELPLRFLALGQLAAWAGLAAPRLRAGLLALGVTLVCALELQQYNRLFEDAAIYDPTPEALTRALDLIKDAPR